MIESVSIETIENMLAPRNTSYKLFLMKYLVENISEQKSVFSFKELSCGIVAMAWEYYEKYYERFTKNDRIYDLIQYALSLNIHISIYSSNQDVFEFLINSSDKEIISRLRQMSACAPYRLLFPFVKEFKLNNLTWDKQNQKIEELSQHYEMFYEIRCKEIFVHTKWIKFICDNRLLASQRVNLIIKKAYENRKNNLC
ncbi:MAG: hypothetical protein HDQ88_00195 [Clostridia bacterium]|nr:hypothetical protein [Clostridia bacterium]